jgi:hypothetical protein
MTRPSTVEEARAAVNRAGIIARRVVRSGMRYARVLPVGAASAVAGFLGAAATIALVERLHLSARTFAELVAAAFLGTAALVAAALGRRLGLQGPGEIVAVLAVCVASSSAVTLAARRRADMIAIAVRADLDLTEAAQLEQVRTALPEGFRFTRAAHHVVPEGWVSDRAGLLLEGVAPRGRFRLWILPRDWLGFRMDATAVATWPAILLGDNAFVCVEAHAARDPHSGRSDTGDLTHALSRLGWIERHSETPWPGSAVQADEVTERLVAAHCHDQASLDAAARTLVLLRVPASSFYRRFVTGRGSSEARQGAAYALSLQPTEANLAALDVLLRDPEAPGDLLLGAAWAAGKLRSSALGPALLDAFLRTRAAEPRRALADALGRARYAPAGPALLQVLTASSNGDDRTDGLLTALTDALASVRYTPALPALRALAERDGTGRTAILRLEPGWGEPLDGLRYQLRGPRDGVPSGQVTLFVENTGTTEASFSEALTGSFVIDGVSLPAPRRMYVGTRDLQPDEVGERDFDLRDHLRSPGTYRVHFERGGARSNTAMIVAR